MVNERTGMDSAGRPRQRRGRWALAVALLGTVTATAACGDGDGDGGSAQESSGGDVSTDSVDFEASPRFLKDASQRSSGEPFRIGMSMALHAQGGGDEIDAEAQMMSGEQDGSRFEWQMDMSEWLDEMPNGQSGLPPGLDMAIDVAGDTETFYIRAPMYAQLVEAAPPGQDLGPVAELAVLGDGWGRVDLQSLGDLSLTDVQTSAGAPGGADPRVLLDLVADADNVEELGSDAIDGDQVNGLGADLSLGEVLEAQGVQVDEFVQQMGANLGGLEGVPAEEVEAVMQSVVDADIPFEVWIDGEGYVRRVSMEMDMFEIFSELADRFNDRGIESFTMDQTMDYTDYGDEGIEIELPPSGAEDAVDATEAYRRMLETGQGG